MTEQCQLCIAMFRGLYGLNLAQEVDLVYLGMGIRGSRINTYLFKVAIEYIIM